ncbi:DUF6893 family small protein [Paenarthrobacter sp. Z7-10]
MKIIGMAATAMALAAAGLAVVVGLRSVPDVQRYLKIRQM